VQNAKRFVTEDKVDLIIGSAATPVAGADGRGGRRSGTVQLAASPGGPAAWRRCLDLPPAAEQ
jgi:branched-chain amino acid transport system substrate-binding protein